MKIETPEDIGLNGLVIKNNVTEVPRDNGESHGPGPGTETENNITENTESEEVTENIQEIANFESVDGKKAEDKDRRLSAVFSKGLYKMAEPLFQDGERKHSGKHGKPKRMASMSGENWSVMSSPLPYACHSLSHTKRRLLPMKNYHDEARAMKDLQKFLANPVLLFKIHYTQIKDIILEMIRKLATQKPELQLNVDDVMKHLIDDEADYKLKDVIQGMASDDHNEPETDQSFITVIGQTPALQENQVVMCLLPNPVNLGPSAEEVHFICLVLSPMKEKKIKSAVEVGRTYATLLANYKLRRALITSHDATEFSRKFELEVHRIYTEHRWEGEEGQKSENREENKPYKFMIGIDLWQDIKRRAPHYPSDFYEGLNSCNSIAKIISTIFFLYFALILPCIAFGVLNGVNTDDKMDVRKVIVSQAFSGLAFSLFGGQPLVVCLTTAPLAIYTKVIYSISKQYDMDFNTFYAMTGLWNCFFLICYSLTGVSKLMKFCSRSTEEIFGLFISIAFLYDSIKFLVHEFQENFCFENDNSECVAASPLVALILTFGTVFIGTQIYNFRYSPYLNASKRVLVADYALVVAVLIMSFCGSYLLRSVELDSFDDTHKEDMFQFKPFIGVTVGSVLGSLGLGFALSLLFFMDQNISSSMVNSPRNRLRKGAAYNLDLLVLAIINAVLSVFGLPWVHGAIPHSPLHVRALADIEEHVDNGHLKEIVVYVRETRITTLIAHILIAISIIMVPAPLNVIPIPVLYGLFLFLSITALSEFQLWERIMLVFTEQNAYPPTHYIRKVPQRLVHAFTFLQLIQLAILCAFSFSGSPYLKMFFPVLLMLMLPVRRMIVPYFVPERYLDALDGEL